MLNLDLICSDFYAFQIKNARASGGCAPDPRVPLES